MLSKSTKENLFGSNKLYL